VILCSAYFRPAHRVPWWKRLTAPILSRLLPHVRFATGLPYDAMTTDPEMSAEAREDPHLERTATPRWFVAMRIAQMQVLHSAGRFRLPVLALHGTDDSVADHQAVRTFIDACGAPDREFRLIPTGRHELLRERFRQDIYRQCMEWIEARLVKSI
jgi:alpha-beta hydrolase superfamily lysophospholipase